MDTLSKKERSKRMSLVKGKDTKPEMRVRRLAHGMGYRYRLHYKKLPGRPDLVFPGRRKVIFVHGCFWHRHEGCPRTRWPKSKLDFWKPKLLGNQERDARNVAALKDEGWEVLTIWECETEDEELLRKLLVGFLGEKGGKPRP